MLSITVFIVAVTSLVSFIAFSIPRVQENLLFWPAEIQRRNQYYRFLTHAFIHADFNHLLFNMIALYSFGIYVEQNMYGGLFGSLSSKLYAGLYLSAIVVAVLPDFFRYRNSDVYRSLGASGAVSAVVFSGILLRPLMPIRLFFIPIDIPGFIFGIAFLILSVVLDRRGKGNVAHGAHFSGAIYGIIYTSIATKVLLDINVLKIFIHTLRFDWIL